MPRCSKCNITFEGKPGKCPGCGAKFDWGATTTPVPASKPETVTQSVTSEKKEERLESSAFLEKYVYVIRSLNFFPVIGWANTAIVGVKFKDYKKSLKENRRHAYKKFMKSGIFWGAIWLVVAILTIIVFKSVATNPDTYSGLV